MYYSRYWTTASDVIIARLVLVFMKDGTPFLCIFFIISIIICINDLNILEKNIYT